MVAGGSVAATRIDCPCGESFMKDGNNPIKCPKEKRIEELEAVMHKYIDHCQRAYEREGVYVNCFQYVDLFQQLLEEEDDEDIG
jgi:hypothetical protein